MGRADTEGDRRPSIGGLSPGVEGEHTKSRYDLVRERFHELSGIHCMTFKPTRVTQNPYELEFWTANNKVFILQHWLDEGGVDVFQPVTDSLQMDDLLAAIK